MRNQQRDTRSHSEDLCTTYWASWTLTCVFAIVRCGFHREKLHTFFQGKKYEKAAYSAKKRDHLVCEKWRCLKIFRLEKTLRALAVYYWIQSGGFRLHFPYKTTLSNRDRPIRWVYGGKEERFSAMWNLFGCGSASSGRCQWPWQGCPLSNREGSFMVRPSARVGMHSFLTPKALGHLLPIFLYF